MRGNATKMGRKKDRIAAQTWQLSSEPGKSLFFIYILIFGILILAECPFPMLCVCVCVCVCACNIAKYAPYTPASRAGKCDDCRVLSAPKGSTGSGALGH